MINILTKIPKRNICSENLLSSENRQKCVRKFVAIKSSRKLPPQKRTAAVLVPLCHVNSELALLYTLRSSDLKTHRGQVSFPGGMRDKSDVSFTDTALRETEEELGIKRCDIDVWCEGNEIPTPSTTVVTPVIGYIRDPKVINNIVKNPAEVDEVFTIPISNLIKPENCKYTQFKKKGFSTPVFIGGPRRIWGLTAVITYLVMKCLIPSKLYNHNVPFLPTVSEKTEKNKQTK